MNLKLKWIHNRWVKELQDRPYNTLALELDGKVINYLSLDIPIKEGPENVYIFHEITVNEESTNKYNSLVEKPVTTTNEQPKCRCCKTNDISKEHDIPKESIVFGLCENCFNFLGHFA